MNNTELMEDIRNTFAKNTFECVKFFNKYNYCAKCMHRKEYRSWHPKESVHCIYDFHLYSPFFHTMITTENHLHYVLVIALQMGSCWSYFIM